MVQPLVDTVTPVSRRDQYEKDGLWNDDRLIDRVEMWSEQQIAVVDCDGTLSHSYGELKTDSRKLARYLIEIGVCPGDVISVQLPNVYEAVVVTLAVQIAGAVINPVLPNYREKELQYIFDTAHPMVIFTPGFYRNCNYVSMLKNIKNQAHHIVVDADASGGDASLHKILNAKNYSSEQIPCRFDVSAISELIFTSGTEANPKAIMHSEKNVNFSLRTAYIDMQMTTEDVVWMPSPVGHSTGYNYGLRFALYHGLKLVLQDAWDAEQALMLIQNESCSYTLASTTFLQDVVTLAESSGKNITFKCFGCGGAPVPADLVDRAQKVGINALRLYGSTEVLVATWNRLDSGYEKLLHTDGIAMSHIELEIRREDGSQCDVGEPGEIYTRGPNTSVGFFNDVARTKKTYDGAGWVCSGDVAVMDTEGHISITGRQKEIIIRGGLNIAPREIEDLILSFSTVEKAAVLPLPDERLGELCCAAVVLKEGQLLNFEDLLAQLEAAGLAKYKWPQRLLVLSQMPATASGKIQKHRIVSKLHSTDKEAIGDFQILADSGAIKHD